MDMGLESRNQDFGFATEYDHRQVTLSPCNLCFVTGALFYIPAYQNECPILAGATNSSNYINTLKFNKNAILEQLQTLEVVEILTWTVSFPNCTFMYNKSPN